MSATSSAVAETALVVEYTDNDLVWHDVWPAHESVLTRALELAAAMEKVSGEVSVLLSDDAALQALNRDWRGADKPTNVLSFPAAANEAQLLGDIALSAETVAREAAQQDKSFEAHATHLIVHGFLHLLGYDHEQEDEAEAMETRERDILAALGVSDPYENRGGG